MPEVRADLTLDTADAFSSVDDLGSALDSVIENFASGIGSAIVAVEDVGAAIESLDPTVDVAVSADVSEAEQTVDSFVSDTDAADPIVTVGVDDDQVIGAQESVAALDDSLQKAGSSGGTAAAGIGEAGASAAGMGVAMSAARGEVGAAASGLGGLGLASKGTAGLVLGLGAAFGTFFTVGQRSIAATERLQLVFGKFSDNVESINVGGLNGQLGELAIKAGVSGAQLRQASADLGQLAQSAGMTKRESAEVTNQVQALALRAVALKPALGEAGDVMNGLQNALARGGRFAARFGLGMLTASQITERASQMTGKAAEDLTQFDKAAAGATLAVETLGGKLGKDFAKGAEQSEVQFKSMKAELISVIATAGRELVPSMVALGRAVTPVAAALGGALGAAATSLVPILELLGGALDAIGPAFASSALGAVALGGAVARFAPGFGALGAVIGGLLPLLNAIDPALGGAAVSMGAFSAAGAALGSKISSLGPGMGAVAGAAVGLGQAIGGTEGNMLSLAGAGAGLGFMLGGPVGAGIGAAAGAVVGLGASLLAGGQSVEDYRNEFAKLGTELDTFTRKAALQKFSDQLDLSMEDAQAFANGAVKPIADELEALATTSPAAARKVADGFAEMGFSAAALDAAVRKGTTTFQERNVEANKARETNDALAASTQGAAVAEQALADVVSSLAGSITTSLPGVAQQISTFGQSFAKAFGEEATPSVTDFVAHLQASVAQTAVFVNGIGALMQSGLSGLAGIIQAAGPEVGSAWLAQLSSLPIETQRVLNDTVLTSESELQKFQYLLERYGVDSAAAMVAGLAPIPVDAQAAIDQAAAAVGANTSLPAAAGAKGAQTGSAFASTAPGGFAQGVMGGIEAGRGIFTGPLMFGLNLVAQGAGSGAGTNFALGLAAGIRGATSQVEAAARAIVRAAVDAANNAGSPSEHLFYDAASSQMAAFAQGYSDSTSAVQRAMRDVVRFGAETLPSTVGVAGGGGAPTSSGGGDTTIYVEGVTDPYHAAVLVGREQAFQRALQGV